MDDSVNFQFWSSPVLDLSLDSFSKEIFQEFDKGVINNDNNSNITFLNNQFIPKDNSEVALVTTTPIITTTEPAPLIENNEHFIAASPTSSSSASLHEDEEEETMSTTDIVSPITEEEENNKEIEDDTTPTDVPASTNISRQSSLNSVSSKVEAPIDTVHITNMANEGNSYTPTEPSDMNTGVLQQQKQPATNQNTTYTTREVMTLNPTVTEEAKTSPAPKKTSFFCFSFC